MEKEEIINRISTIIKYTHSKVDILHNLMILLSDLEEEGPTKWDKLFVHLRNEWVEATDKRQISKAYYIHSITQLMREMEYKENE